MIITRLSLLLTIVHCCTTYGSNPNLLMDWPGTKIPQKPTLLFITLQRAVEKEGFDTVLNKVENDHYKRLIRLEASSHLISYAFLWNERIDLSDKSPTAQLLLRALNRREIGTGGWYTDQKYICEEQTRFTSDGLLRSVVHDHRKNDILAMLEELKPLNTRIINSILTNSNTGPL